MATAQQKKKKKTKKDDNTKSIVVHVGSDLRRRLRVQVASSDEESVQYNEMIVKMAQLGVEVKEIADDNMVDVNDLMKTIRKNLSADNQ